MFWVYLKSSNSLEHVAQTVSFFDHVKAKKLKILQINAFYSLRSSKLKDHLISREETCHESKLSMARIL